MDIKISGVPNDYDPTLWSYISHDTSRLINTVYTKRASGHIQGIEQVDAATRSITFVTGEEEKKTWHYDLLVGAEGALSVVRKVLVKSDKKMKSQLSYIGPMRYVSARWLLPNDSTASESFQRLISPPDRTCLLYTSPSPRDRQKSRMPSSA